MPERGDVSITFIEHPDGRHRTHMRNTMSGWVEERDPEGTLMVTLEDGFCFLIDGDECQVNDADYVGYLIGQARQAKELHRERTAS